MGTDLSDVMEYFDKFKLQAKYWFQCIGIPRPEFEAECEALKQALIAHAMTGVDGGGVGNDSK